MKRSFLILVLGLTLLLSSCNLPQVKAEDRLFLEVSLDFLGEYRLPKLSFDGTRVGGLSGITYDRQLDRFYAISDDRSEHSPARFYTLKLNLNPDRFAATEIDPQAIDPQAIDPQASETISGIQSVDVEKVTPLLDQAGNAFERGTIDLEGIALSPRHSLFIASEGVSRRNIPPFVAEFDLETGAWLGQLPTPDRYLPATTEAGAPIGVQDNLGFEALTISANGYGVGEIEPFRIFAATESALHQDLPAPDQSSSAETESSQLPARMVHYLVSENRSTLLSEHLYLVEPPPERATMNGLAELVTLDQGGHFLSLERSFGLLTGFNAQIFQLAIGGATDISSIPELKGDTAGIVSIYKQLELNLAELGIPLDNLEGMAIGPRLPDGTQSLVLVSDDNFNLLQSTQFLLFRLRS
ncbi:esterase-like activity of phytase family protein [Egbenema bharatensis]|uniref:esterase-like activity of phytase family protein n=1 Tax=Egbenema bharatensis TaxID=3463334 RepID=UPI003A8AA87B